MLNMFVCILTFSNSCHYLYQKVFRSWIDMKWKSILLKLHFVLQKISLSRNLEKFLFCVCDVNKLHNAKHEILVQLNKFDIMIDARGFFEVNRRFVAGVSFFIGLINNTVCLPA